MLCFRIFDKDKNGTLDKDELKTCLQSLGEQLTDDEVDELFNALDTDRNGRLSVMGSLSLKSLIILINYNTLLYYSWYETLQWFQCFTDIITMKRA